MLLTGASVHQQRGQNRLKPQERKENSIIPMKWDFAVGKKKAFFQEIANQPLHLQSGTTKSQAPHRPQEAIGVLGLLCRLRSWCRGRL